LIKKVYLLFIVVIILFTSCKSEDKHYETEMFSKNELLRIYVYGDGNSIENNQEEINILHQNYLHMIENVILDYENKKNISNRFNLNGDIIILVFDNKHLRLKTTETKNLEFFLDELDKQEKNES
jgi:hypothetical protein